VTLSGVQALAASDDESSRALILARIGGTRYCERTIEQLEIALTQKDPEYSGLIAVDTASRHALGVLLYGSVAGATGVVKLHTLIGHDAGVLDRLIDALQAALAGMDWRMIVCEVADDSINRAAANALLGRRFVREASVRDFVAKGTGLEILVHRRLSPHGPDSYFRASPGAPIAARRDFPGR
jgi:hypothetical protein